MKIKINFDFGKYKKDQEITIKTIGKIPEEKYWRDRIKDSEIDGCVTIVKSKKEGKSEKQTATEVSEKKQES